MGNWRHVLKIDLGATKRRKELFNLIQEVYPAQPSCLRKNSLIQNFFTIFVSFLVNKCPLYGQMETWASNRPRCNKAAAVLFYLAQEVYQAQPSSSRKNSLSQLFFSQFCYIPREQMTTLWANGGKGLKSTSVQQSSGSTLQPHKKRYTKPNHPLQQRIR